MTKDQAREIIQESLSARIQLEKIYEDYGELNKSLNALCNLLDSEKYQWLHYFLMKFPTQSEMDELSKVLVDLIKEIKHSEVKF